MRNLKLVLEYDGTNYHGFQSQATAGLPTIQGELERVLQRWTGEAITVIGASRTDAGVHARGQVVNFHTSWPIPVDKVPLALNSGGLPPDIVIKQAEEVEPAFHAQFWAKNKTYCYTIYNSRIPSAFWHRYSWYVPVLLDSQAMAEAARFLLGTHDFAAFRAAGATSKTTIRTINQVAVAQDGPLLTITINGNGFLYNMVRIIAGTLVEIGKGKLNPEVITQIIASRDRNQAGPTAPPQGLCLLEVNY
ncbi:tRNA pseudouridine(38-40) synthase TruA [Carboxydocella sp. JDF658]|uniref:tRNA pseudouridine(38-40) synthase TruA n=1 Tax=Carboxydocella sp. JDF658 TaxID=1926600 RepID=UPI0009AC47EF|nr:tRNA pseudouridine(38-40) synthase TruA [Carboxydocella sp. JDF658]GAW30902.1 tRNA pseudouridine(38-40) synthase TruA [Carboxydocella sp. JDF658]